MPLFQQRDLTSIKKSIDRRLIVRYGSIAIPVPQFRLRIASGVILKYISVTAIPPPRAQLPVPPAVYGVNQFGPFHSQQRIKILVPQMALKSMETLRYSTEQSTTNRHGGQAAIP